MTKVMLAALMLTVGTAASAADTLKVDLNKALEIALSDNPTIKIADKEIERVDYSQQGAWYGLIPTLSATAQYTRNALRSEVNMGGLAIKMSQDNQASLGLSLSLPLIVPGLWYSIQMTDLDMKLALENARSSKITLRNDVKKAFYGIMLAQDSYEALKEGYDLAKQNFEDAKHRFEVGLAAEYDMVSAEVQMRNIVPTLLQAENGVRQSKLMLKVLIGVGAEVEMKIDGKLVDFEAELQTLADTTIPSLENNSNLIQLGIQKRQIEKSLQMQRTQYMPTLVGFGSFSYTGSGNDKEEAGFTGQPTPAGMNWYNPGVALGVQLSWPIFNGLTVINKTKQIKIQGMELEMQREYLANNLGVQAIAAIDNMNKAVEQVESNKENVRLAQKGYDISQKRYETGSGTMLELRNAALALTQSRLSYDQSISDYLSAKSEYEKVVGL